MLGDPERWGGAVEFAVTATAAGVLRGTSGQVVRVQCTDLVARAWDVSCHWIVTKRGIGALASNSLLGLEITFGAGQATATESVLVLATATGLPAIIAVPGFMLASTLDVPTPRGTTQATTPIAAVSMAIRGIFSGGADGALRLDIALVVTVSPRALSGGQGVLTVGR